MTNNRESLIRTIEGLYDEISALRMECRDLASDYARAHSALAECRNAQKHRPLAVGDRVRVVTPEDADGTRMVSLSEGDVGAVTDEADYDGDILFRRDGTATGYYIAAANVERIEEIPDGAITAKALNIDDRFTRTPTLPTKPGTIIRATGEDDGAPFKDVVLILDYDGFWRGDVNSNLVALIANDDSIDTFTVLDTHDPATQAAVPREEWEALKSEVRSVVASAGADLGPDSYIARKARALVHATEEVER